MTTPKSKGPGRKPGRVSSQKASQSSVVKPRKESSPNQQNIPQTVKKVCVSCGDDERMRPEETRCAFCRKHDVRSGALTPPTPLVGEDDPVVIAKRMRANLNALIAAQLRRHIVELSARALLPTEEGGVDVTTVQTSRYQRMQMVWDAAVAVCEAEMPDMQPVGRLRVCIRNLRGLLIGGGE